MERGIGSGGQSVAGGAPGCAPAASMPNASLQGQATVALAGLLLVLLSLGGTSAQITPSLNLTTAQNQGIANVSLVTATAFLSNAGVGIAGQNITFSTVGNTGALPPSARPDRLPSTRAFTLAAMTLHDFNELPTACPSSGPLIEERPLYLAPSPWHATLCTSKTEAFPGSPV